MKKRSFLLIELLIAMALVSLVAVPIMQTSIHFLIKKKEKLLQLELERNVEWKFIKARAVLARNHKWGNVTRKPIEKKLSPLTISIEGLGTHHFDCFYHIKHFHDFEKEHPYRKFWCEIFFSQNGKRFPPKKRKKAQDPHLFFVLAKRLVKEEPK